MQTNDPHPAESTEIAKRIIQAAMQDESDGVWASHEEIALTAQSGIQALPETDRDRVLRAIANNADGAAAVFDLARIPAHEFLNSADSNTQPIYNQSKLSESRNSLRFHYLALPSWGLAASVMLVSGIGLLLDPNEATLSRDGGLSETTHHTSQTEAMIQQIEDPKVQNDSGFPILLSVFIVAVVGTCLLTPFAWRRFRKLPK